MSSGVTVEWSTRQDLQEVQVLAEAAGAEDRTWALSSNPTSATTPSWYATLCEKSALTRLGDACPATTEKGSRNVCLQWEGLANTRLPSWPSESLYGSPNPFYSPPYLSVLSASQSCEPRRVRLVPGF